jgi:NTP pyrophosphatase (non-canonical NTP hydrolase)
VTEHQGALVFHDTSFRVSDQDLRVLWCADDEACPPLEAPGWVLTTAYTGCAEPRVRDGRPAREVLHHNDLVWIEADHQWITPLVATLVVSAMTLGVPVFAREPLRCEGMALTVTKAHDVAASVQALRSTTLAITPSHGLSVMQRYYKRMAEVRDYRVERPQDAMLLLTEEIGELARAIRERVGVYRADDFPEQSVADELADVQLYILHLANVLHTPLSVAVSEKEVRNHRRACRALAKRTITT